MNVDKVSKQGTGCDDVNVAQNINNQKKQKINPSIYTEVGAFDINNNINIEDSIIESGRQVLPEGVPLGATEREDGVYEFRIWDETKNKELVAEYKFNSETNRFEIAAYTYESKKK